MKRTLAIALLTLKAAFRYRLIWVLSALLLGSVVLLPLLLKDDGTARGFTQILITYTLSVITFILGMATLWLACGTLAKDIEDQQIQLVVVKPVSRWQIWLGKLVGIWLVNLLLLSVAGASVYAILLYRAQKLPPEQKRILNDEVLVSRGSLKEPATRNDQAVEQLLEERLKANPLSDLDRSLLRQQIEQQVIAAQQIVPPNYLRRWTIDLGWRKNLLKDQNLYLRVKFFAAQTNEFGTYLGVWQVGVPDSPRIARQEMSLAPDTFHEFPIPPNLFDEDGKLTIDFINRNDVALLFPLDEGLEVLYREGGFGLNFVRGLTIVFCWIALLGVIGMTAASFLSFPVAAFCSLAILVVGLSSGTISRILEEGTVFAVNRHTGVADKKRALDYIMLPTFQGLLRIIKLAEQFSPIDSLSTGRSISWEQLGRAIFQILVVLGGIFAAIGIYLFSRRELALPQQTS